MYDVYISSLFVCMQWDAWCMDLVMIRIHILNLWIFSKTLWSITSMKWYICLLINAYNIRLCVVLMLWNWIIVFTVTEKAWIAVTTRKPSYRWQTRATRKSAKNCSNSTCLQRCRWQYWPIFMRLAAVTSEICEIPRNSLKIQTYEVQGHPRSSILVPIESPYVTCY